MYRKYYIGGGEYRTKEYFFNNFNGGYELFNYCWNKFLACQRQGYLIEEIEKFLDNIASEQVNNPESRFYLYG